MELAQGAPSVHLRSRDTAKVSTLLSRGREGIGGSDFWIAGEVEFSLIKKL